MELQNFNAKKPYENVPTEDIDEGEPTFSPSLCRFEKIVKDEPPYLVAIDNISPYKDIPEEESSSGYLMAIDSSLPPLPPPSSRKQHNSTSSHIEVGSDYEDSIESTEVG